MAKLRTNVFHGWDARLLCYPDSLTYDFKTRTGRLDLEKDNCCDMEGALKIFQGIDPKVEVVESFAGGVPDTVYRKRGKEWVVIVR